MKGEVFTAVMIVKPPGKIRVEEAVLDSDLVSTLRKNLPHAKLEVADRISEAVEPDPDVVEVVHFKGRFLKSCPGTRHYFCCGYRILHFGVQCNLACSYCVLQAYLNLPNLRLFGNTRELIAELESELDSHTERLHRIGTGEFTDSLLLDPWTEWTTRLVPLFAQRNNAVLELKTKTNFIENLRNLDHRGHTIAAWSLNAGLIAKREEPRAASLDERFHAAARCASWGYPLAFHFDPMIEHEGWRKGYGEILDRLFDAVDPSRVVWISLGAFRFMPDLKPLIRGKHPRSRYIHGEFIRGLDDKMRYFRDIRIELYSFMLERIRRVAPDLCVYLCMEGRDIWREVFGFSPEDRGGLPNMLDSAVKERMNTGNDFAA